MNVIREYLQKLGYQVPSDDTYNYISQWADWYKGYVKEFHSYTVYNGIQQVSKERYRLDMAKTICEDWASFILNEKVEIHTGSNFDKTLAKVFTYNNFRVKANQLVELAFALGTGAFVEYLDETGQVVIDYIRADMIYPLSWENGYVNECAFGSTRETTDGSQVYIQIHRFCGGRYIIENHLIDAETGKEIADEDILSEVDTYSAEPLFQLVSPNIVNNINFDSPMGISVFGNAISQVQGCDLVYDSYINEFELGRQRVLVPLSMATMQMSEAGSMRPVFDPHDTVFYAIPDSRENQQKIEPMHTTIRAQEHEIGITKALDLLSFKCGMGTGRYRFENGAVRTATEVISSKSDLYQNLKKHEIIVGEALRSMVRRIAFLTGYAVDKVAIDFDDSIIQDKDTERACDRQDVAMGAMSLAEYRMKWYGETAEEAAANVPGQTGVLV